MSMDRLPALPIIANDPFFSVWSPCDRLTDGNTIHWSGPEKPLCGTAVIDGTACRWLGTGAAPAMETVSLQVTPTATISVFQASGVELTVTFRTPALPVDFDLLSLPVTILSLSAVSADGKDHEVSFTFSASDNLTYDGDEVPDLTTGKFPLAGMNCIFRGQTRQKLLSRSADHITIDWGYLYLVSSLPVSGEEGALSVKLAGTVSPDTPLEGHCYIGYDDIASILYFGTPCKAWYARKGKTLTCAIAELEAQYDRILSRCKALDEAVLAEAEEIGGSDYRLIAAAAWRHTFAAHKLISTPGGEPALLSKENDSNGCIGTVDVSYPSSPLFLRFAPRLAEALCRPVLEFASMPVWDCDFAPHDVGRYPIVNGQVYAVRGCRDIEHSGGVFPPHYLYPAGSELYDFINQMPVEECGNMLIMLCAAAEETGDYTLIRKYRPLLDKWVQYLLDYGEDPGHQLCTDDFAGHLAHNVNLSAKAVSGVAMWGRALTAMGEDGSPLTEKAKALAESWLSRAKRDNGTALTFDGDGWSMKYNLIWDRLLSLGLLPESFYEEETRSYLGRMNAYGLPLDSRSDYTKSDWLVWAASLAPEKETFRAIIAPLARYLRETKTRVPFSDWYYTSTGDYVHFIARSVQGGLYMPFLMKHHGVI